MTNRSRPTGVIASALALGLAVSVSAGAQSVPGWTFFGGLTTTTTHLIDEAGDIVHTWPSSFTPGVAVYLMPNGEILRTCADDAAPSGVFSGGAGGRIQRVAWDGTVLWDYDATTANYRQHHDLAVLPNGNILTLIWERKTQADAIAAGRIPANAPTQIYGEAIIEIEPTGPTSGNVVWEWHAWDHLVQNFDDTKPNFADPSDHPERIDINFPPGSNATDWVHWNAINYNAELDQILVGGTSFDEIWIISRASGDIVYRWGNPRAYGMGTTADQSFFNQHDPEWIPDGLPGAGNIAVFNNGVGRPGGNRSSADEIILPPMNPDGTYFRVPGQPFGPTTLEWTCDTADGASFYSNFISGTQRLPNDNTLICLGSSGTFIELDEDCNIVWTATNPSAGTVFRADRVGELDPRLWSYLWCAQDVAEPTDATTVEDLLAFLAGFFTSDPAIDIAVPYGTVDSGDLLEFIAAWFSGC